MNAHPYVRRVAVGLNIGAGVVLVVLVIDEEDYEATTKEEAVAIALTPLKMQKMPLTTTHGGHQIPVIVVYRGDALFSGIRRKYSFVIAVDELL